MVQLNYSKCVSLPLALLGLALVVSVSSKATKRIVGGIKAAEGEFPYQVSIRFDGDHFCSGAIISPTAILFAGHCISQTRSSTNATQLAPFSIKAGAIFRTKSEPKTQTRKLIQTILHENYRDADNTSFNDIAIAILDKPLKFNSAVQRIKLPKRLASIAEEPKAGTPVIISGWGVTVAGQEDEGFTEDLLKVQLNIVANSDCKRIYTDAKVEPTMVCAGTAEGGRDACYGDSGGPLVTSDRKTLLGIVSFGRSCGEKGVPGIYTKVTAYLDWIKQHSGV